MKKFLSILTLLLAVCSGAWAAEETISLASYTVTNNQATLTSTSGNVTVVLSRTSGTTPGAASSSRGLRWQSNCVITVSLASGHKISSVKLTSGKQGNSVQNITYTLTDGTNNLSGSWNTALTAKQDSYTWTAAENTTYDTWILTNTASSGDLYISAVTVNYEVSASTTEPTITTQPQSATYESGDTPTALTVAALASAGDLSYQWYSNTTASNEDGTAIDGETNASYSPSTATAGTYYYYCVVTDDNGSSASNAATITVVNAIAPVISYASASNTVTITCKGAGTIYYTTDNSEPTASSTPYTAPFVLTDAATVRAVAIKGGNASEIVFAKCKVDHSATALAVIGFGDGTHASGVWTSNDGNYTLTSSNGGDIQYYTVFSGQDGFKINATNGYTLKVSDNIKVTSIKFVGISRADAANDATIALDGFTPASATIEKGTFVKTVEFTPTSELGYGATINITTGGNQFGGYFEIYGEEYTKETATYVETTWDFTSWSDATKTGVLADGTNWNQKELESSGNDFGETGGRSYKKALSGDELQYDGTTIEETDGLNFTAAAYGMAVLFDFDNTSLGTYHGGSYIWLYGSGSKITIPNVTKGSTIEIGVESHKASEARGVTLNNSTQTQGDATSKTYQVCKWTVNAAGDVTITPSKGLHIYYIKLQKAEDAIAFTPAYDKTTYVTTKALDFSNVDGLKAYVATKAEAGSGSVTLSEVGAVPAETPLMLIGTAGTEYTIPVAASATAPETNMFKAGDGTTEFNGSTYDFILYSDGLFYQIGSGTVATTKAYLHCESDPRAAAQGARGLSIVFEDETTGIGATLMNSEKVNNEVYNLNGQRVMNPAKGLYIVNGKKVVIK